MAIWKGSNNPNLGDLWKPWLLTTYPSPSWDPILQAQPPQLGHATIPLQWPWHSPQARFGSPCRWAWQIGGKRHRGVSLLEKMGSQHRGPRFKWLSNESPWSLTTKWRWGYPSESLMKGWFLKWLLSTIWPPTCLNKGVLTILDLPGYSLKLFYLATWRMVPFRK